MDPRFARLPRALAERAITRALAAGTTPFGDGGVPALLAHPDEGWAEPGASPTPRPFVIWLHGRTVSKELDPGRYLRWQRAGIATCAIDLPGHGERLDPTRQGPDATFGIIEQCAQEIDLVLDALRADDLNGAFDLSRVAIGGMSAGGMVALHRLCRDHPFACAAVEATSGDFQPRFATAFENVEHGMRLSPIRHLERWRPIPMLALHSEADEWVPVESIRTFIDALRARHADAGADPELVTLTTWPETGAPSEHVGFGRYGNDAKNIQTRFLARHTGVA